MKAPFLIVALLISCAPKAQANGESLCRAKLAEKNTSNLALTARSVIKPRSGEPVTAYDFVGTWGGRADQPFICLVDNQGLQYIDSGPTILYKR
ncbi:hypothetical protein [Deinococcus sp. QL22]|uniref:hypothetical protein n=1 Tax=Deinococcus sp. QL22 TaxID=2939437 RepID=UPI002017AEEF|nr:hypothetical protein [Deinococcus sp. QL22]UQN10329.1 hypothetical protein M1R55_29700 [Deinococcus sp. QL22]UQN10463.1 hypothetical protein M1R55_29025 [Deinococcus sp. QL22]